MSSQSAVVSPLDVIERHIRTDVQSMRPYPVQDASGMVKLDAMENPYTLPEPLQAALGQRLGRLALNRYPDGRVNDLRRALAAYAHMPTGFDIVLGNGSDELISLLSLICAVPVEQNGGKRPVAIAPVPGFVMYGVSAQLQGLDFVGVPLTADFELDVPALCQAIARHEPALVYLAYPNNPTANLWSQQDMAQVIAAAAQTRSLVVVDEAYQPFASHTYLDVMRAAPQAHQHVVLMRTLSKFGLAGVRLGYLLGPQALVEQVEKVRPPYNISVLNTECALFALEHQAVFAQQAAQICAQRTALVAALRALPGVTVWDSQANMVLMRLQAPVHGPDAAQKVFAELKARGILVKNVSTMHPLLANCLRLTVGTDAENAQLQAALAEIL